jgi:hypothetical protein
MGAELWYHRTPWHADPEEALRQFQADFLAARYDLPAVVRQHLDGARESVEICTAEGDPYNLLDLYRAKLALLEEVSQRPLPEGPQERIELLRRINADSGQGIGNILDVKSVSKRGGLQVTRRLGVKAVTRLAGTGRPTVAQAEAAIPKIHEELRRGESVCFPIYAEGDKGEAVGWYFVGHTVD